MFRRIVVLALASTFFIATMPPAASAADTPASHSRKRATKGTKYKLKKYNKKKKGSKASWGKH